MVTTPHDAEEELKPYLGAVHDRQEALKDTSALLAPIERVELVARFVQAQQDALDKALELLGVQR